MKVLKYSLFEIILNTKKILYILKLNFFLFHHRVSFFLIFRHLCGTKIDQKNKILIILDTRLIWNSNLN
jgi:hypothetical protein